MVCNTNVTHFASILATPSLNLRPAELFLSSEFVVSMEMAANLSARSFSRLYLAFLLSRCCSWACSFVLCSSARTPCIVSTSFSSSFSGLSWTRSMPRLTCLKKKNRLNL